MDLNQLMEIVEIDTPSDFSFFEHYAELVESEEEIPVEVFSDFFAEIDGDVLTELTEGYFEDILKYVPEDAVDFYTLLMEIGQTLTAIASNLDSDDNYALYAEEFFKFRNWYTFDSEVICTKEDDDEVVETTIAQALTLYRLENLNDDVYSYDFSETLDYPLDEYIVPISDLTSDEDDDDDEEDEI